jgi:hypothetical protein
VEHGIDGQIMSAFVIVLAAAEAAVALAIVLAMYRNFGAVHADTVQLSLEIGLVAGQGLDVRPHTAGGIILQFLDGALGFTQPAFHFQQVALHLQILLGHDTAAQQQTGQQQP